MARVIGIDYGKKRVGVAVTDPLQYSVRPLISLTPDDLIPYLENYLAEEEVSHMVIGMPETDIETESEWQAEIRLFKELLSKKFTSVEVAFQNERYSSQDAMKLMIRLGVKKKNRKNKELLDQMSAVIIVRRYLQLDI